MSDDDEEVQFYSFVLVNEDDREEDGVDMKKPINTSLTVLSDLHEIPNEESEYFTNLSQAFYSKRENPSIRSSLTKIDSHQSIKLSSNHKYAKYRKSEELRNSNIPQYKSYQIKRVPKAQVDAVHPDIQKISSEKQFQKQFLNLSLKNQQPNAQEEFHRKYFIKPKQIFSEQSDEMTPKQDFVRQNEQGKNEGYEGGFQGQQISEDTQRQIVSGLDASYFEKEDNELESLKRKQTFNFKESNGKQHPKLSRTSQAETQQDSQGQSSVIWSSGSSSNGASIPTLSRKTLFHLGAPIQYQTDSPYQPTAPSRNFYFSKLSSNLKTETTKSPMSAQIVTKTKKRLVFTEAFDKFNNNQNKTEETINIQDQQIQFGNEFPSSSGIKLKKESDGNLNQEKCSQNKSNFQFEEKQGIPRFARTLFEKDKDLGQEQQNEQLQKCKRAEAASCIEQNQLDEKLNEQRNSNQPSLQQNNYVDKQAHSVSQKIYPLKNKIIQRAHFLREIPNSIQLKNTKQPQLTEEDTFQSSSLLYKCNDSLQNFDNKSKTSKPLVSPQTPGSLTQNSSKNSLRFQTQPSSATPALFSQTQSQQISSMISQTPQQQKQLNSQQTPKYKQPEEQPYLNRSQQQQQQPFSQSQMLPSSSSLIQKKPQGSNNTQQNPSVDLQQPQINLHPPLNIFSKTFQIDQSDRRTKLQSSLQTSCVSTKSSKQQKTTKETLFTQQSSVKKIQKSVEEPEMLSEEDKPSAFFAQTETLPKKPSFLQFAFKQQEQNSGKQQIMLPLNSSSLNLNKYSLKNGLVRMPQTNNSQYQNTSNMNNSTSSSNKGKNHQGAETTTIQNHNSQHQSLKNIPPPPVLSSSSIQIISPLSSARNHQQKKQFVEIKHKTIFQNNLGGDSQTKTIFSSTKPFFD